MSPEWWGRGLAIMLIVQILQAAIRKGYEWVDMSLTGEDNPDTNSMVTSFGGKVDKRYRVYALDL